MHAGFRVRVQGPEIGFEVQVFCMPLLGFENRGSERSFEGLSKTCL